MRKKILVNAYFAKNLGDDLFLKVLFDKYPQVDWYLLTPKKVYADIFKEYKNVNILKSLSINILGLRTVDLFYRINKLLKYSKYDGLVNIGGSIFMEGSNWATALEQRKRLPAELKNLEKKTFIIGANFGPFKDSKFVGSHKDYFSLIDDICFRDQYSYNLFKELGNVRVAPDIVFNLKLKNKPIKEKSIGFSLINLKKRKDLTNYYEDYNNKIIQLIEHHSKRDYKIKLFSFCESEGDLVLANHIRDNVDKKYKNNIEIINYNGEINIFLEKFQSCETIIGTRFHSIILGLLNNQNVFPIIYSDKTYNVLKDLHLEEECCFIKDIKNLNTNKNFTKFNKFNKKDICVEAKEHFRKLDLFIAN